MLGWLIERTRMGKILGQWHDATQLDPGDRGQVAVMASQLIRNAGMRLEDAWLSALVNWTYNHPEPESKFVIASSILRFLDIYGHSAGLSPECREASREVAKSLVANFAIFDPAIRLAGERLAALKRAEQEVKRLEEKQQGKELHRRIREKTYTQQLPPPPIAGSVTRSAAYRQAIEFVSLRLCEEGYGIDWMGESRGDVPSLIAEKGGVCFHVLLHLDIAPASTTPAPFVLNRFKDEAAAAGAYPRLARVVAFSKNAVGKEDKGRPSGESLGFTFTALEAI